MPIPAHDFERANRLRPFFQQSPFWNETYQRITRPIIDVIKLNRTRHVTSMITVALRTRECQAQMARSFETPFVRTCALAAKFWGRPTYHFN